MKKRPYKAAFFMPLNFRGLAMCALSAHEQGLQRFCPNLTAPVAVNARVKRSPFGQKVCGIKMLAGAKDARRSVLQTDLHLAAQNETPLCRPCAVKSAAKAHRALPQLKAAGRKHVRKHGLRCAVR